MEDDAQITFRQVWNFINGDGITFNFNERVQAFSHPLWFIILSIASFITNELFVTTTLLSIFFSVIAVYILIYIEYSSNKNQLFFISPIYLLVFSFSFVDYATSGLENSLSYFIFSILIFILTSCNWKKHLNIVYVLLALLVLNRIDYVILFGPLAILLMFYTKNFKNLIKVVSIGALLLILWFTFSTIYFGSPFPNTYFAKLNSGYPIDEVLERGKSYFFALKLDIVTPVLILLGIILSILSLNRILISLVIGEILYLLYIYKIGGDFMQGRFFSLLVLISVYQLSITFYQFKVIPYKIRNTALLILFGLSCLTGLLREFPVLSTSGLY